MKKLGMQFFCFSLCFLLGRGLAAQAEGSVKNVDSEETPVETEATVTQKPSVDRYFADPQIAMSAPGYLVTAGDVYSLTYAAMSVPVSYLIHVDSSYKVRVSNLAVLDTAGKTYLELKSQVESVVTKNYPMSGVQFVLLHPAVFTVTVNGEVTATAEPPAWALTRLSAVVDASLTSYSSTRDIMVTSVTGKSRTCDLFKAERFGDLSEDPFVRPGDVITVQRRSRLVTIEGAVERPGAYQLKDNEGLDELIRFYGNGFTPVADSSRMELVRHVESESITGDKLYLDASDLASNFTLKHFDALNVPVVTELLPVMFVEGAVGVNLEDEIEKSTRIPVQFNAGENYASLVRRNRDWFGSVSDTANAYLVRGGTRLPLNLNPMLYDVSFRSKYVVQNNDILVIPFRQYFVTVSGAVALPGRFAYIPDRDWFYYINQAGGFDPARNSSRSVTITDVNGRTQSKTVSITPETNILANSNAFLYYFNQYAPIVTTSLTVLTTVLTLIAVTAN